MDPTTHRGLAFLLSLGTLQIACKPEDGSTESGVDTTSAGSTGGIGDSTTSGITSTGTPTTDDATTGDATTGDATTGSGGSLCEKYVAKALMCDPSLAGQEATIKAECEADLAEFAAIYGAMCGELYEEYAACLSQASCEDPESACDQYNSALSNCSPPLGEACQAHVMKYAECLMEDPTMAGRYCQITVNTAAHQIGPMCGAAYEEFYACTSSLSCAEFEMGDGCAMETMAVNTACGG